MISTSGRSSRHLLGLGLFLALCLLASCSAEPGLATQVTSTTVVPGTPAASVALPTQPSPVSTPTATLQPTTTPTPTAVPPTETPQPSPTATLSPTATATPLPPTPTVVVAEGEALFEKEIDEVQVSAAVPEQVVPILEAGRVGTGSVEGVQKAGWRVEDDVILLGGRPVFVYDEGEWRYDEHQWSIEEEYLNLPNAKALISLNPQVLSNPAPDVYPFSGLLITDHESFSTINVQGVAREVVISDVVLLYQGSLLQTQQALISIEYQNPNTGSITTIEVKAYGEISVDNNRGGPFALLGNRGPGSFSFTSTRRNDSLRVILRGGTLLGQSMESLRQSILAGGRLPERVSRILCKSPIYS